MLELLVSMVVGALIALALTNFFSETLRVSSSNQNEAYARTILSELTEYVRSCDYSFLVDKMGNHTILINRALASETGSNLEKSVNSATPLPPALMDYVNLDWDAKAKQARFPESNQATVLVQAGPSAGADPLDPDTLQITVTVTWKDSKNFDQSRSASSSIVRTKLGANL
ncbi:MAG: hypothetical protein AB7W16_29290 [Candidatus Obscuribacterales bacterium]